jgi:hypothetical protein
MLRNAELNHHVIEDVTNVSSYISPFVSEQQEGGTQLKLIIDFASGGQALFKPMR